jgi:Pseudouridylate synthases, 23S RNA-specific
MIIIQKKEVARIDRLSYLCRPEDAGLEVLSLLRREFHLSANLLRQLKTSESGILLDGVRVTVRQRVAAGQELSILREPDSGKMRRVPPAAGPLDIVYEDGDLLILNKPAGLAVHPSPGHRDGDTLGNRVVWYLSQTGQSPTFRAINRLDRGTSGLMTCAKTSWPPSGWRISLRRGTSEGSITPWPRGSVCPPRAWSICPSDGRRAAGSAAACGTTASGP